MPDAQVPYLINGGTTRSRRVDASSIGDIFYARDEAAINAANSARNGIIGYLEFNTNTVTVGTSLTSIGVYEVAGFQYAGFRVTNNSGTTALNAFQVLTAYQPLGNDFVIEASTAAHYTTDTVAGTANPSKLIYSVHPGGTDPRVLGAGVTCWIRINVQGVARLQIRASTASGSASISINGFTERYT